MRTVAECRRVLLMVQELHVRGYQRLRVHPGLAPSGLYWRCSVRPAAGEDRVDETPDYTSGQGAACFGWTDAERATPARLARLFVERFPATAAAGAGADWAYAGWFVWMLHLTYPDALPIATADRPLRADRWETVGSGRDLLVPLPPPIV